MAMEANTSTSISFSVSSYQHTPSSAPDQGQQNMNGAATFVIDKSDNYRGDDIKPKSENNSSSRGINTPYKEKFLALRQKYETVNSVHEDFLRDLEVANSRMRRLQSENDLLLDAVGLLMAIDHQQHPLQTPPPSLPSQGQGYPYPPQGQYHDPNSNSYPSTQPLYEQYEPYPQHTTHPYPHSNTHTHTHHTRSRSDHAHSHSRTHHAHAPSQSRPYTQQQQNSGAPIMNGHPTPASLPPPPQSQQPIQISSQQPQHPSYANGISHHPHDIDLAAGEHGVNGRRTT